MEEQRLTSLLQTRRWFGDKGRQVRRARIRDAVPVAWPASDKRFMVARADVVTDEGTSTYQLFSPSTEFDAALVEIDALEDADFRRGLADAWRRGIAFEHGGVRWTIESETHVPLVVPVNASIELSSAEQTNSSIVLNREAILKLYRRLERGVHPDVEVTRFLTRDRQFARVPALLGTIRFEDAHGVTIAGMLQEYVQGAMDAWQYTRHQIRERAPFARDAEALGVLVRSLHQAMASGDEGSAFEHRHATAGDVQDWIAGARRTVARALETLGRALRQNVLPADAARDATGIADRAPIILRRIESVAMRLTSDGGAATRIHGDLHLGQILRSPAAQFLVIDFEGEPSRPLDERRRRSSPLRDVAGMLRSFSYAALSAIGPEHTAESREPRAEPWESDVRSAFLRGYLAPTDDDDRRPLVPASRDNSDALVNLFETEKAFYELQYELDHRPDWAWIPLRGITRLT